MNLFDKIQKLVQDSKTLGIRGKVDLGDVQASITGDNDKDRVTIHIRTADNIFIRLAYSIEREKMEDIDEEEKETKKKYNYSYIFHSVQTNSDELMITLENMRMSKQLTKWLEAAPEKSTKKLEVEKNA